MGRSLPILGVPGVLDEHKRTLIITDFTQSLGAELLTNGDFSAWTGDNPDGWTVEGETAPDPEVTERDPNQGHADTKTVGGAANFYSSATNYAPRMSQAPATVGLWYEVAAEKTASVASYPYFSYPFGPGWKAFPTKLRASGRAMNTLLIIGPHTAPIDFTLDNISVKRIMLNTQQTMPANAIIDFTYILPGVPASWDNLFLFYRVSDVSLDIGYSCWQIHLQRNFINTAWYLYLDSVNAGTVTNRVAVTGVGSPTTIRVICDGTKHNCYTLEGTTWTKRGTEVDVSWNDSATGLNTIYCSGMTPTKLTVTPL